MPYNAGDLSVEGLARDAISPTISDSQSGGSQRYNPTADHRLIVVRTNSVGVGTKGYQTSRPINNRFRINGVVILCEKADPDIWVRFGTSFGPVTDDYSRVNGLNPFLSCGATSQPDLPDAVAMDIGGIGLTDLGFEVPDPSSCVFVAVDNRSTTNAVRVTIVFKVTLLPESE